jgi:hypothetical protein
MKKVVLLCMFLGMAAYAGADVPTTGLQLHLDASSLAGYSNGQTVSTWTDTSGAGNNATSAGAPKYVANAINGLPVISIPGTSDRYGNWINGAGWGVGAGNNFYAIPTITDVKTIAMVFKPTSNSYFSYAPIMAGPTSDDYGMHGDCHYGNAYWDCGYSIDSVLNSTLAVNGTVAAGGGGYTGVDYDHFSVVTIQLASGTPFDLGFLAHTARYNDYNEYGMQIAELLVYNQQLSAGQLAGLTQDLGAKYGIAVTPEPATLALFGIGACLLRRKK